MVTFGGFNLENSQYGGYSRKQICCMLFLFYEMPFTFASGEKEMI